MGDEAGTGLGPAGADVDAERGGDPQLTPAAYLRALVFAAALGIPVAFAAVLFETAIHDLTHLVWEVVPDWLDWSEPSWWYVVLVPALAGLFVAAAERLPGHGGHTPLEGLSMGSLRPVDLPGILLAGLASLGLGLVLGPEAPLIALGLGLGVLAVGLFRVEENEGRLLVLAGAFAAVAALFGGPLVAAFLLIEVVAKSGMIPARAIGRALLPGFVAAGSGALVFTGVAGWSGLHQQNLSVLALPAYDSVRIVDLAWCGLLAVTVAVGVLLTRRIAFRVAALALARPVASLVVGGLLVGVLAVAFRALADRPAELVLFSGQSEMPTLAAEGSAGVLLLLVLAKGLAYSLSLGVGFRGGPIFPAIAIGTAFTVAAADILPGLTSTPAVATGIAAATAVTMQAPFTAALLGSLLVGSSASDVAPFTVLAAAVGLLVAVAFPEPEPPTEAASAAHG
jgi:chloride channel protein, CIC family